MPSASLISLFKLFFVIGASSFGGHMALVAMVRKELVDRLKVITDAALAEGISLASLLPGPMAVNVVAYAGYQIRGAVGAMVSLVAVLVPSFIMVLLLSFLYFTFEASFPLHVWLAGVIPGVIGIIGSVGYGMLRKNTNEVWHYLIVILSMAVIHYYPGYWSIIIVFVLSGLLGTLMTRTERQPAPASENSFLWLKIGGVMAGLILSASLFFKTSVWAQLFVKFSLVSVTLFGGGYVMIPLLEDMLVNQMHWVNPEEFALGISLGQVTPGPILISAVFFGYKVKGMAGALLATISIFFPSSLLMIGASSLYQSIRRNNYVQSSISGIRQAVVGLILYSGVSLFVQHTKTHSVWLVISLTGLSFIMIKKANIHTALVVLGCGVLGVILGAFGIN
jgi:chromate transporter